MTAPSATAIEQGPEGPPALSVADGVAVVTLQRPSQRNSLTDDDLRVLLDHLARIEADASVRVLVLRASTRGQSRPVFCAGYHVGGFDAPGHDPRLFERVPDALEALRPVTICALGGSVYGGATDLVLACDLRVALDGIEWRMPAVALGLHIYPGALRRYVARLGIDGAKRAFLTARAIGVHDLERLGLFERVVDASRFDSAVDDLVHAVAALAPLAAAATKQSLNEIASGRYRAERMREREGLTLQSADFAEGRAAFAQRRPARFSGR